MGEKEEAKRFSLWVHCLIKGNPTLKASRSAQSRRGTCIIKNAQVPPFPSISLKSLATARLRHGRGEPPAARQSRVVLLPGAVLPLPLHASAWVPQLGLGFYEKSFKCRGSPGCRHFPIPKCSTCAGNGLFFAHSSPLPVSLWSCTDVIGASELLGDKTARFGPRDAFLSLLYKQTALSYNSRTEKAKPAGGR